MISYNITDKATHIKSILSGSCSPASDLLDMVEDGYLTAGEATLALQQSGRKVADVHSAASIEHEHMLRLGV